MAEKIIQLIPVPDNITTLFTCAGDGNERFYFDPVAEGICPFFALMDNGEVRVCDMSYGNFDFDDYYWFIPTVHCKRCGQRMSVEDIPYNSGHPLVEDAVYRCRCGMNYNTIRGWFEEI